jgi:hypothetical protein
MNHFTISAGTYPFDVLIYVGDADDFKKHLQEIGYSELSIETQFGETNDTEAVTMDLGRTYAIWFSKYENTPFSNAIVAHECFHLTEMIFEAIGMEHSPRYSSEAFAYQIQFFVERILEKLNT